ncbi:MAG: hypothetical protein E6G93_17705 [Alphaproteobacteria bacterium]|nr:MAG: hypothetical protein E6G93_17705 [Alphaproteobacteria bacterium]
MGQFDLERVDQRAGRLELVEHDLCGDAETAVDERIVPDLGIGTVVRRGHAIRGQAIGRQRRLACDHIRRIVVVHGTADQQVPRPEVDVIVVGKGTRDAHDAGQENRDGQTRANRRPSGDQARFYNVLHVGNLRVLRPQQHVVHGDRRRIARVMLQP